MEALIWIGAAVSLCGLGGLVACIVMAMKARAAGLGDDALRARLKRVVALNFAALMISALGLMSVVLGIILG
ncbi:hypothetical protein [Mangrovicoccus algicola]|uniref:Uncharacterized protein n=1 Tax=Mangrovicoccus algicola TaxID=2771008 RepID=A0A8J7CW01_9RHOB|nr:hypothetical protein [Mangrovicoccus algicola]MBE3637122.1 hypothetical protein [Mangrovicoccus algicola]